MITKQIQAEFSGILAFLRALKRAWKAYRVYNKAIKTVSTVIIAKPSNEWAYTASERTQLSYKEAQSIYTFILKETNLCTRTQNGISKFVIELANRGHTAEMIILYLQWIDTELNKKGI